MTSCSSEKWETSEFRGALFSDKPRWISYPKKHTYIGWLYNWYLPRIAGETFGIYTIIRNWSHGISRDISLALWIQLLRSYVARAPNASSKGTEPQGPSDVERTGVMMIRHQETDNNCYGNMMNNGPETNSLLWDRGPIWWFPYF